MHALRRSTLLARLVLAWFAMTLGVAFASPIVQPQALTLVCTTAGVKLMAVDGDGQQVQAGHHTLDCSLCVAAHVPPPAPVAAFEPPHPLAHALHPPVAAHLAALAGASLPARGPPSLV